MDFLEAVVFEKAPGWWEISQVLFYSTQARVSQAKLLCSRVSGKTRDQKGRRGVWQKERGLPVAGWRKDSLMA